MLRALKSSLKHRRKHVLRPLQLYGNQALDEAWSPYGRKDRKHVLVTMSQKAYYSSPDIDCKNLLWEIAIIKNMRYHMKKSCFLIAPIILNESMVHG